MNSLFNYKGVGVNSLKDKDSEYKKLNRELEKFRTKMPNELSKAVDTYLTLLSYANHTIIFNSSLSFKEIENVLPVWVKAGMHPVRTGEGYKL